MGVGSGPLLVGSRLSSTTGGGPFPLPSPLHVREKRVPVSTHGLGDPLRVPETDRSGLPDVTTHCSCWDYGRNPVYCLSTNGPLLFSTSLPKDLLHTSESYTSGGEDEEEVTGQDPRHGGGGGVTGGEVGVGRGYWCDPDPSRGTQTDGQNFRKDLGKCVLNHWGPSAESQRSRFLNAVTRGRRPNERETTPEKLRKSFYENSFGGGCLSVRNLRPSRFTRSSPRGVVGSEAPSPPSGHRDEG